MSGALVSRQGFLALVRITLPVNLHDYNDRLNFSVSASWNAGHFELTKITHKAVSVQNTPVMEFSIK